MAHLVEDDEWTRKGWLRWAIELRRRGLRPLDEITVHGPHAPPADRMWGEAECQTMHGFPRDVEFETATVASRHELRRLRMRDKESNERFPVLPARSLPKSWRDWIKAARKELKTLPDVD